MLILIPLRNHRLLMIVKQQLPYKERKHLVHIIKSRARESLKVRLFQFHQIRLLSLFISLLPFIHDYCIN